MLVGTVGVGLAGNPEERKGVGDQLTGPRLSAAGVRPDREPSKENQLKNEESGINWISGCVAGEPEN